MGNINVGQTNPDEPDYFPPFLRNKLVQVGLIKFIHTGNVSQDRNNDWNEWKDETDSINQYASLDFLNKATLQRKEAIP